MIRELKLARCGVRIRYRDTRLVLRTMLSVFGLSFSLGVCLLLGLLLRVSDAKGIWILSDIGRIPFYVYLLWLLFCVLFTFLFWIGYEQLFPNAYARLEQRQRIARFIVDNGYYESENKQREAGFFSSTPSSEEVVVSFPKIYYRLKDTTLTLTVEVVSGRYQKQLLSLEEPLETLLFCELTGKELKQYAMEYTFLCNVPKNRILISDVVVKDGKLRLMKDIWWKFDKLPHALIVGGTGGGKTYLILTLIDALLKSGASISILDPKRADLSDLAPYIPNVYDTQEDMMAEVERFYKGMMERMDQVKEHPRYRTGKNYAYFGLEPHFLIFDEYVAFMEMVGRKREEILSYLKQIAMLGRQAGYFLILACQRPDSKYFGEGMRDQFHLRLALGKNSEMGYSMVFGSDVKKQFYEKDIKGRGYISTGTGVIREFYAPFVPDDYDFLENIKALGLPPTEGKVPREPVDAEPNFEDY